jgi:hypothetical protein
MAEYRKVLDRRAKARARNAAKADAKAEAAAAEQGARRDVLAAVFDGHPAAVDATYYPNMYESGAEAWAIGGYRFTSDAWVSGRNISERMLAIAEETTAKLIAPKAAALVGGRRVLAGVIRSAKLVDTTFGYRESSTYKMTVELDGGQRVYGSVPNDLFDALNDGVITGGDAPLSDQLRGLRVEFTATVQVSDDDPGFGYYSRPAKASVAAQAVAS